MTVKEFEKILFRYGENAEVDFQVIQDGQTFNYTTDNIEQDYSPNTDTIHISLGEWVSKKILKTENEPVIKIN